MIRSRWGKVSAVCLALLCVVLFAFAGCAGGGKKGTLKIRYFVGGYGSEGLVSASNAYKAEHPGVEFELVRDQ